MEDPIPLVDLVPQHRAIAAEVEAGFAEVIGSARFIGGPRVEAFEAAFARFAGVAHCVGVGNGTDALELVMRALGIGRGDEVILPAATFVATALAVLRAGATPVLVDVDEAHSLIDPARVAERIGPRTRAVCAVHLYGQMAPMEALEELARGAGLALVEDAAQAHGATRHGRSAGGIGAAAGTSFYPGKNLGAWGDAGAVLTRDPELAARLRRLRNHGSERKYEHTEPGFNSRLDALQAVVLEAKLRHLPGWNAERRAAAARYDALLDGIPGLVAPRVLAGNQHVWHLYVVRVPERDRVRAALEARGIETGIHYPRPLHCEGALAGVGPAPGALPRAERAAQQVLSLPLFPQGITAEQQQRVADALRQELC